MGRAFRRAVFWFSILALLGLVVWSYSAVRTWQDVAMAADKTQANAMKVAKAAAERADRCVEELYKANPPQKSAGKAVKQ